MALATISFPVPLSPRIRTRSCNRRFFYGFEDLDHLALLPMMLAKAKSRENGLAQELIFLPQVLSLLGLPESQENLVRLKGLDT